MNTENSAAPGKLAADIGKVKRLAWIVWGVAMAATEVR